MFLSEKIPQLEEKCSNQQEFNKAVLEFLKQAAAQIDLMQIKVDEALEQGEGLTSNFQFLNANLQTIKEAIVGDIKVDTDDYSDDSMDNLPTPVSSGDNEDEEEKEFLTLMCKYCEELFFIETEDLSEFTQCPFCNKEVRVDECRIDS